MKTIVVVGAGKGMGNHIGERFAKEGFRVVLIARRKEAIDQYVEEFKGKGFEVVGIAADATNKQNITTVLKDVLSKYGIDVLVYNAALLDTDDVTELTTELVLKHFNIDVVGAVACVETVLPEMRKNKSGTILFTGGILGVFPTNVPTYANLTIGKAVLRHYALMLNKGLEGSGVYAGIVNITGSVGSTEALSPAKIAEDYWKLYTERKEFEIMSPRI